MPGLNRACLYVVNLSGWQRYSLTLLFAFILSVLWYFTFYMMLEKKQKNIASEIVQIMQVHQDALLSKQAMVQLIQDCELLKNQIGPFVQASGESQLDLIKFCTMMSENKIALEQCAIDQFSTQEKYLTKKITCLFKSNFSQLMIFLADLMKASTFFGCQELLIHKNDQGLLLVQGIFESVAVKENFECK